jgi:aconitase A
MPSLDSLKTLKTLKVDDKTYHYFSLPDAAKSLGDLDKLPMSLKVLLENLLRWEDEKTVTGADLKAIAAWLKERRSRNPVPPGAGIDARLYRRPRRGRPGRDARRHGQGWR